MFDMLCVLVIPSEPEENSQSPDVLENGHESSDLEILKGVT